MSHSTAGSFPAGRVPQSMLWPLADMPERSRFVVPMQGDVARTRGEVTVHAAIAGSIVPGVAKLPVSSASARSGPHFGPGLRCAACRVPGTSKYPGRGSKYPGRGAKDPPGIQILADLPTRPALPYGDAGSCGLPATLSSIPPGRLRARPFKWPPLPYGDAGSCGPEPISPPVKRSPSCSKRSPPSSAPGRAPGSPTRPCPGHPCAPSRSGGRRSWPACFRARCDEAAGNAGRTPGNTMHPMFRELFLPADADLLAEEEETRRAVNRPGAPNRGGRRPPAG
jgi:hypothetical protein